jgi:Fur family ferric uptake transcriptional regulator
MGKKDTIKIMRMRSIRKSATEMRGYPVTTHRQLLLRLIHDVRGHIDAKELYRRAIGEDQSISLATVYRNLHLFKELGLVNERRLGQAQCYYEIKQTPEHHHLVCRGCGKIVDFASPLIGKLVDKVQREHSFNVTKIELYLEGYCERCKEKTGVIGV